MNLRYSYDSVATQSRISSAWRLEDVVLEESIKLWRNRCPGKQTTYRKKWSLGDTDCILDSELPRGVENMKTERPLGLKS